MRDVQKSLDRAAMATVFLLLGVLLAVYRSAWLAAVPLATIGISLVISRGILAWLARSGLWEISPLVELFLVVILFGSGTDFCLFLSWRFGEHWDGADPAGAMRTTMKRAVGTLGTSAGTVIAGLLLMGFTRFKLFSSTGPSVALGLALSLGATLSLTPALLVLLAKHRPQVVHGSDPAVVGVLGRGEPPRPGPSGPRLAGDAGDHAAGRRAGDADDLPPGHLRRTARADPLGPGDGPDRLEIRTRHRGPPDGRA